MNPPPPLLAAEDLSFAFGTRRVLSNVSVHATTRQIVALLGPNGCGKSTLLRVLLGQHRPSTGQVRWDGLDVFARKPAELARRVAYLPQQPGFLPGQTVAEAIAVGRYPHQGLLGVESARDAEAVRAAAATMDLTADLNRPVGILSGGQRQRVFLARCLAQQPAALLLDEPDTFLDLRHVAQLATVLRRLARPGSGGGAEAGTAVGADRGDGLGGRGEKGGVAVILATHNLHLAAAVADRVVLMSDGEVVQTGPPEQVITPDRIAAVYGVRAVRWTAGPQWGLGILY